MRFLLFWFFFLKNIFCRLLDVPQLRIVFGVSFLLLLFLDQISFFLCHWSKSINGQRTFGFVNKNRKRRSKISSVLFFFSIFLLNSGGFRCLMLSFFILCFFICRCISDTIFCDAHIGGDSVVSHWIGDWPKDAVGFVGCVEYNTSMAWWHWNIVLHCYIICNTLL